MCARFPSTVASSRSDPREVLSEVSIEFLIHIYTYARGAPPRLNIDILCSVLTFGEFVPKWGIFGVSGENMGNSYIWGNIRTFDL